MRRQGIGKKLVEQVFIALKAQDIHKCHIMVFGNNEQGLKFWQEVGWTLRTDIVVMSHDITTPKVCSPC